MCLSSATTSSAVLGWLHVFKSLSCIWDICCHWPHSNTPWTRLVLKAVLVKATLTDCKRLYYIITLTIVNNTGYIPKLSLTWTCADFVQFKRIYDVWTWAELTNKTFSLTQLQKTQNPQVNMIYLILHTYHTQTRLTGQEFTCLIESERRDFR